MFAGPRRSSDAWFTVLAARHDAAHPARLGLAIAKKQVRLATRRNRIKRVVRETFRRRRAALHGHDVVVMARRAAAAASNRELVASLEQHFAQLLHVGDR